MQENLHLPPSLLDVLMGLTASCFGLGATLSNLLGQIIVERMGHVESLLGSLVLSFVPLALFGVVMPETLGHRGETGAAHIEVAASGGGRIV